MLVESVNGTSLDSVQARILETASKFHLDQQGRAPDEIRAYLQEDIVVVYTSGIYTATEQELSLSVEGRKLIKSSRRELRSLSRRLIEEQISLIVGRYVLRSFWDLDIRTGEQVEVYMLGASLDSR